MNEQRIPEVERIIRKYYDGAMCIHTEVETVEHGGESSFVSITFIDGNDKITISPGIARNLCILVSQINENNTRRKR